MLILDTREKCICTGVHDREWRLLNYADDCNAFNLFSFRVLSIFSRISFSYIIFLFILM